MADDIGVTNRLPVTLQVLMKIRVNGVLLRIAVLASLTYSAFILRHARVYIFLQSEHIV